MKTTGTHYFAARETDAAFIRLRQTEMGKPAENEKFLFYRGVGNFETPLNVTVAGANEQWFQLRNTGTDELKHLFILSVRDGRCKFAPVDGLAPGQSLSIDLAGQPDRSPLGEVAGIVERGDKTSR